MNLPNFIDGQEGVVFDLPDADYRKAAGVSNSMLKAIATDGAEPGSPAHFVQSFLDPNTDGDDLFIGRMVHSRILTQDEPLPGVVEIPENYPAPASHADVKKGVIKEGDPIKWSGNAKYCKAWLAAQEAAGLRPMKADQIKTMDGVVKAVSENPICRLAFQDGRPEVSLFKRLYRGRDVVMRKARVDWVPGGGAIVDIKTCQDARGCEFDSVLWSRRYYVQAAYYLDLWNELNPNDQKEHFIFVAVEKAPPYAVQIFAMEPQDLEDGRREYRRNLYAVMDCMASGIWPAYPQDIQPIKMRVPHNRKLILPE